MEKPQAIASIAGGYRGKGANELIVIHEALGQAYRAISIHRYPGSHRQAWPEDDRIKVVAFSADILMDRAVIVGTGQR